MQGTRLEKVITAALGRRRRFGLDDARAARLREQLLALDPGAREERRLTCYLDRTDGSLVMAALSRPWACLEISCATRLADGARGHVWELSACRTRGPTLTQARLHVEAELLPALARGDAPRPRGDGSPGANRKLAAWRGFLSLRGNGPLVPSILVVASRLEVRTPEAALVLESSRAVHLAPLSLLNDAAGGHVPEPAAGGRALPGAVLEVQPLGELPAAMARLLEGREARGGSAFAVACAAVFPAGVPGGSH